MRSICHGCGELVRIDLCIRSATHWPRGRGRYALADTNPTSEVVFWSNRSMSWNRRPRGVDAGCGGCAELIGGGVQGCKVLVADVVVVPVIPESHGRLEFGARGWEQRKAECERNWQAGGFEPAGHQPSVGEVGDSAGHRALEH